MSIIPLLLILLLAIFVYISAWYVYGFLFLKRIDSLDSAWGLGFVYIALITLFISNNFETIPLLSTLLVMIWGIRLSYHITKRNMKKTEDPRYGKYREKFKSNLNQFVYIKLFLPQATLVLLISFASIGAINGDNFSSLAYAGLGIWIVGIIFEATADAQLKSFLSKKTGKLMTSGLWRYSRHPNYFGEITSWFGAGIVAVSAGNYWGLIGTLTIYILITKVSGVPLLEKKYEKNSEYQKYKTKTSKLIPLPQKS